MSDPVLSYGWLVFTITWWLLLTGAFWRKMPAQSVVASFIILLKLTALFDKWRAYIDIDIQDLVDEILKINIDWWGVDLIVLPMCTFMWYARNTGTQPHTQPPPEAAGAKPQYQPEPASAPAAPSVRTRVPQRRPEKSARPVHKPKPAVSWFGGVRDNHGSFTVNDNRTIDNRIMHSRHEDPDEGGAENDVFPESD